MLARGITIRDSPHSPLLEDAVIHLVLDPLSPSSTLIFPLPLLYPLHAQSDFVKAISETDRLARHLAYIFPLPWDVEKDYAIGNYMYRTSQLPRFPSSNSTFRVKKTNFLPCLPILPGSCWTFVFGRNGKVTKDNGNDDNNNRNWKIPSGKLSDLRIQHIGRQRQSKIE